MRFDSVYDLKAKYKAGRQQKMPKPGTKIRRLWDLLQMYKGEVIELPLSTEYNTGITYLIDFYGLDIRKLEDRQHKGRRGGSSCAKWILAGEWFGSEYVDYISRNKRKLKAVEKVIDKCP